MSVQLTPDAIAKILTIGARRACVAMSANWQPSGTQTFNPSAAESLFRYTETDIGELCERTVLKAKGRSRDRNFYRLTPLGLEVQKYLK